MIPKVVRDFRRALSEAIVYVYDNNSRDRTCDVARTAGAVIGFENMQGKGNIMRRMFANVEADIYVIVVGEDTSDAATPPRIVSLLWDNQLDMVSARRLSDERNVYRAGHRFGNKLLSGMIHVIFGDRCHDVLFPALAQGFDIEAELTIHALELNMPIMEVDSTYKPPARGFY